MEELPPWSKKPAAKAEHSRRSSNCRIDPIEPKRNPKGCKESSRWSESAETTGSDDETNRTPEGCQIHAMNIPRLKIRIRREWRPVVLHPSRGAVMTNDFSGGLRGLRPPATFFATLRVALRSAAILMPSHSLALGLTLTAAPQLGE